MGKSKSSGQSAAKTTKLVSRVAKSYHLDEHLVLNQWLLNKFGKGKSFVEITSGLDLVSNSGIGDNGYSEYLNIIIENCDLTTSNPEFVDKLYEYDKNIQLVTNELNRNRVRIGEEIHWKYFQYFALLATEIYLDSFFDDPEKLRNDLNELIVEFNQEHKGKGDSVSTYDGTEDLYQSLNKIAYWIATGGGKTLIMHANILQYIRALDKRGRCDELDNVILITPSEDLSRQHYEELRKSGVPVQLFSVDRSSDYQRSLAEIKNVPTVRIIEIQKIIITEVNGEIAKIPTSGVSVAVESFEGNNLVIVDEGHSGASSSNDTGWMERRKKLCENGFSFEYSATFAQAMNGALQCKALSDLRNIYSRCILFDYSYKLFHQDGFGKDYYILNITKDDDASRRVYLTGCLIAYFQQLKYYLDHSSSGELNPFSIKKPLLVFVGSTVNTRRSSNTGKEGISGDCQTDIETVLHFIDAFVQNKNGSTETDIRSIFENTFISQNGLACFENRFDYLKTVFGFESSPSAFPRKIFSAILEHVFNNSGRNAGQLTFTKINSSEISLQIGESVPFGVVYVGDADKLKDILNEKDWASDRFIESEFSDPLFAGINHTGSPINVLIGAKKFYLGWNSSRVSTMGLIRVGKSEGTQIIQLFGRGVRLWGWNRSLKRSNWLVDHEEISITVPPDLEVVETLNIFGVRADYMKEFKDYLEKEGVRTDLVKMEVSVVNQPILSDPNLHLEELKRVGIEGTIGGLDSKDGVAFKKLAPSIYLQKPTSPEEITYLTSMGKVVLNRIPAIEINDSQADDSETSYVALEPEAFFLADYPYILDVLDYDELVADVERAKLANGEKRHQMPNILVTKSRIKELLADKTWYKLLIPSDDLYWKPDFGASVRLWQRLASDLVCRYLKRFYTCHKNMWEKKYYRYFPLSADDTNLRLAIDPKKPNRYSIEIDKGQDNAIALINRIEGIIHDIETKNTIGPADQDVIEPPDGITFINVKDFHFYDPLLGVLLDDYKARKDGAIVRITPTPLNKGEMQFVQDLRDYISQNNGEFKNKRFYLLRNHDRGPGMGFFEDGFFFPDFVLWIREGDLQYITFIDPKGLIKVSYDSSKIGFAKRTKEIQEEIKTNFPAEAVGVSLNSFIISTSLAKDVVKIYKRSDRSITKTSLAAQNVLFQEDKGERNHYIKNMLKKILADK